MKLSISTYSLLRWRRENGKTLEDTIAAYRDVGAEGIEFSGLDEKSASNPLKRAARLRKACERAKLPVASYCIGAAINYCSVTFQLIVAVCVYNLFKSKLNPESQPRPDSRALH